MTILHARPPVSTDALAGIFDFLTVADGLPDALPSIPTTGVSRLPRETCIVAPALPADPGSEWKTYGLCREVDPELFYPETGQSSEPARRVCRRCPVIEQCLTDALERREPFGVWGGKSALQRTKMLARRDALAEV